MSAEVEQRVNRALDSLLQHDLETARAVREGDDPIDQFDIDVEAECAAILALHQPVAGDLRYVMAALRINADLEKMADLARGIAKRVIKLEVVSAVETPPALREMASAVRQLLSDTLRALADSDDALAQRVREDEKSVDRQQKALLTWIAAEIARDGHGAAVWLDVMGVVRSMERIADLCGSIAESVVFAVRGRVVRHQPLARPR